MIFDRMEVVPPFLLESNRGMHEVIQSFATALNEAPHLMGDRFTAADLLMSSTFAWYPAGLPELPAVQHWHTRCRARAAVARTMARDQAAFAKLKAA